MSFSDLPSLSNLIQHPIWKGSCSEPTLNGKKEKLSTDPRLKNWHEWMKKRKKMHLRLANLIKRDPGNLLMNTAEEVRQIKEQKTAFEYSRSLQDQDCEVPSIESIGVPEEIMVEKDVMPRERNQYTTWKESAWYKKKCEEYKVALSIIQPHKPDFNMLQIRGCGFLQTQNQTQELPNEEKEENLPNVLHSSGTKLNLRLAINDFVMTRDSNQSTRKVYLMYDYDVSKSGVETRYVTLKNLGNATIHYYWKSAEILQYFKDLVTPKQHNTAFCFNKKEGLVIPGQTRNIPIWFETNSAGVYVEHWEFHTRPRILPENAKVVIVLHATAEFANLEEEKEKLKKEIENSIRNRLIKDTLSSVFSNVQYNKRKPTIYAYNKKEVFEAMSGKYDPVNLQPKYQYNKEVVRELQRFYKTVRRKTDPKSWNYNIHELRILTDATQRRNEENMQR
ncbi:MYCBP-associated protein-like [Photinus pyralis]|uniref:MYCBP-associated protein-like n=1 Tax=Photinus pyralis TaxID=7054 RepID=UPI001266E941|nr:MYCBP-associated protein-like [Photinus pyralis]